MIHYDPLCSAYMPNFQVMTCRTKHKWNGNVYSNNKSEPLSTKPRPFHPSPGRCHWKLPFGHVHNLTVPSFEPEINTELCTAKQVTERLCPMSLGRGCFKRPTWENINKPGLKKKHLPKYPATLTSLRRKEDQRPENWEAKTHQNSPKQHQQGANTHTQSKTNLSKALTKHHWNNENTWTSSNTYKNTRKKSINKIWKPLKS